MLELILSLFGIALIVVGFIVNERSNNDGQGALVSYVLFAVGGIILLIELILPAAKCGVFNIWEIFNPKMWEFAKWRMIDWTDAIGGILLLVSGILVFLSTRSDKPKIIWVSVLCMYISLELLTTLPIVEGYLLDQGLISESACSSVWSGPVIPSTIIIPPSRPDNLPTSGIGNRFVITHVMTITLPVNGGDPVIEERTDVRKK